MAEAAGQLRQDERAWWLRIPLVLTGPRHVFAALRDDEDDAADARQEPLAAVVFLAGVGGVLATTVAEGLLDDPEFDALLVVVWAIVAGAVYGIAMYIVAGFLVFLGASFAGSLGTYRRARHLLAYAAVPVILTLLLVALRAALYGEDAFTSGGADDGADGAQVLDALEALLFLWALGLVVVGIRVVHGWTWPRAASASLPLALVVALSLARAYGLV